MKTVAFKIYDIDGSGAIEPPEIKRFLVAVMADNPDIHLDDAALDRIVADTIAEVDLVGDGRINPEEWKTLVQRNPTIISFMTLPVLTQVGIKFPASPETQEKARRGGKRLSGLSKTGQLDIDGGANGNGGGEEQQNGGAG